MKITIDMGDEALDDQKFKITGCVRFETGCGSSSCTINAKGGDKNEAVNSTITQIDIMIEQLKASKEKISAI